MIQLWVNLPAKDKKRPPHYQSITAAQIPDVPLPDNAGLVQISSPVGSTVRRARPTHSRRSTFGMSG